VASEFTNLLRINWPQCVKSTAKFRGLTNNDLEGLCPHPRPHRGTAAAAWSAKCSAYRQRLWRWFQTQTEHWAKMSVSAGLETETLSWCRSLAVVSLNITATYNACVQCTSRRLSKLERSNYKQPLWLLVITFCECRSIFNFFVARFWRKLTMYL